MRLVAPRHVGSSWIRNPTHISCMCRRILYFWVTEEALHWVFFFFFLHWVLVAVHRIFVGAQGLQSTDGSVVVSCSFFPQAALSMGILQARILEWVALPCFRGSSQPKTWTQVSHISGGFFIVWATREAWILERVAISSSMGSSQPRDQTQVSYVSCIARWVLYH